MTTLDDYPLMDATTPANPAATPRKCRRHEWQMFQITAYDGLSGTLTYESKCYRCGVVRDEATAKRGTNNRKRGTSDELRVADILGGRKVGPLGLPWDVVVEGYLRAQCKKVDRWPSLNEVVRWLDAIPEGPELRAVTLADTPGAGRRTRRLIVMDLDEFARYHGKGTK